MKTIYLQALGIWLLFAVVANINGIIRNLGYGPFMPELTAHQLSCLTGAVAFGTVMFLFFRLTKAEFSRMDLFLIGSMWLAMTICFEFLFGHYVIGHSWDRLLADYNLLKGRLWVLILLWTWLGPLIMGSLASGDLSLLGAGANRVTEVS
ncbi:hypothetical protein B6U90_07685 [Thermoplasmatales archaeon ex4484_6]|nr:MAG: hypothetical protein B6U90_07685 [Thermoplasmatales archaeon ex4484_6]